MKFYFVRMVSSFELEHRPHKLFHRLACRIRRGLVVACVRIDLHARVLVGERLAGLGIDDRAERLLLELARTLCEPFDTVGVLLPSGLS